MSRKAASQTPEANPRIASCKFFEMSQATTSEGIRDRELDGGNGFRVQLGQREERSGLGDSWEKELELLVGDDIWDGLTQASKI